VPMPVPGWGHVGAMLGLYAGPMLAICWSMLGSCLSKKRMARFRLGFSFLSFKMSPWFWSQVELCWALLVPC